MAKPKYSKKGHLIVIADRQRQNGITEPFSPYLYWRFLYDDEKYKRATARNIIDSYQNINDLPIELVQNAVDALEYRFKHMNQLWGDFDPEYRPQVWVVINLKNNELTLVDNGQGMDLSEVQHMLTPNYTFKDNVHLDIGCQLRGHKGVGATYLAYGFNYIRVSTVGEDGFLCFEMVGGRDWAAAEKNASDPLARPSNETIEILHQVDRGTAVTVRVGKGTRPTSLSRIGTTVEQWAAALRSKTAIGFTDFTDKQKWAKNVAVTLTVIDRGGNTTTAEVPFSYPLPHLYPDFDFLDLKEYSLEHPGRGYIKLSDKNKDAVHRVWTKQELVHPQQGLVKRDDIPLLWGQNAIVYGFFGHSSTLFEVLNEAAVGDKKAKVVVPGVWVVSHNAVIGRTLPLELGFGAGNEDRFIMLVQLDGIRPDLGRKGFDPELEDEIRKVGERAVRYFVENRQFLKPAGLQASRSNHRKELHTRVRDAEKRAAKEPLAGGYSLQSVPVNEPEVIGLFQEMLGRGEIIGYQLLSMHHSTTYDGIFSYELERSSSKAFYHPTDNLLGISLGTFSNQKVIEHPPSLYEYKVTLDSLIVEFASKDSKKQFEHVDLVVVWEIGKKWQRSFDLLDLIAEGIRTRRELYGTTHIMTRKGADEGHVLHVVALEEVVKQLHGNTVA